MNKEYMTTEAYALELIKQERMRQVVEENFLPVKDDSYVNSELAHAAATYLLADTYDHMLLRSIWPWDVSWFKPRKEGERINDVVKAAALAVAELERIIRLERSRGEI